MRLSHMNMILLAVLSLTACNRPTTTSSNDSAAPAIGRDPQDDNTHYTKADYDKKCFTFPGRDERLQAKMVNMTEQDIIDMYYLQNSKNYPNGACGVKALQEQQQRAQQAAPRSGWVENAPAPDMSHYGDALPGKH